MERYFGREFAAAHSAFERVSREDSADVVALLFAERCARYLKEPPPRDWNAFEQMEHK
jgi:adenylate cyclase